MKYDYIIYIGAFQPPTLAEIGLIEEALGKCSKLIVLIASPFKPRTIATPWTWQERSSMIRKAVDSVKNPLVCKPLRDILYNNQQWVQEVQNLVTEEIGETTINTKIGVMGSPTYEQLFPQWEYLGISTSGDMYHDDIRAAYYMEGEEKFDEMVSPFLSESVNDFMKAFALRDEYETLVSEFKFLLSYWKAWAGAPHPVTFITVDAVVIQSGHVLLVRRRSEPGKGLWALPGGFLNQNERIEDASIRELREETKLKVPVPVLRGSIKASDVYDHPDRSLRGRTVTHAFLFELAAGDLPKVKGADDADKAKWVPLGVFGNMEDQLFEDHYHIVNDMIGKL